MSSAGITSASLIGGVAITVEAVSASEEEDAAGVSRGPVTVVERPVEEAEADDEAPEDAEEDDRIPLPPRQSRLSRRTFSASESTEGRAIIVDRTPASAHDSR
ncbi:unnamed protein product [Prorocentrum cordatum]|uniref:Secreted protein n=1 Tax=Prorocentrum cordatum TaxID=2364126 RepID=A0ABN9VW59_9DINO|nr:unnamed protein product [Polarella glacialis]